MADTQLLQEIFPVIGDKGLQGDSQSWVPNNCHMYHHSSEDKQCQLRSGMLKNKEYSNIDGMSECLKEKPNRVSCFLPFFFFLFLFFGFECTL